MSNIKAELRAPIFAGFLIAIAIVSFTQMAFLVFIIISGNVVIKKLYFSLKTDVYSSFILLSSRYA